MTTPLIIIEGFEPLRLTLPADADLAGRVQVQLPPVHVTLVDLSLGGLIPDRPHIGMDAPMTCFEITLSKPSTVGDIVNMLLSTMDTWQALWRASQQALDGCGALLN